MSELYWPSDALLNILLFVPLGVMIGLCPRSRGTLVAIASAFVLPFAIEGLQLVVTPLGRECQSSDVFDNLTGLTLGLLLAVAIELVAVLFESPDAAGTDEPT